MTRGNYERILEKIAKSAGISLEEIERRIEAKRSKLSGLISKEGAAQVVAAELGISFENEKLKIDELLPGMRRVNLIGKIVDISPVRSFKTKRGDESKVVNLLLADDTSNIKVVLWDTNHISLIEKGEMSKDKSVEIGNASMRDNELHLGSFSEIKISNETFENVVTERIFREKNILDLKKGESAGVRAFIVQIFTPRFFNVCPECNKKVVMEGEAFMCQEHKKVVPEKRSVTNVVLDDGTETIRAVLFNGLDLLGITETEDVEKLTLQKESLLGKEMIFSGNVRNNAFFNNPELILDEVKELDLDHIIKDLEK